jgi:head-tail adaptor
MAFGGGERDQMITFERATVVTDSFGSEVPSWITLRLAWAAVRYGSGEERRVAAVEQSAQAATFTVLASAGAGVTEKDRIGFGGPWDIRSVVPSIDRAAVIVTAVRSR